MKDKISYFWKNFIDLLKKREMSILPGHLAFFFVLSIVPIISLIVYVATSFNISVHIITDFIENSFSTEVANLLSPILTNHNISFQSIFVLFVAFYLASNGADSIIIASNTVFNLPNLGYLRRRIKAIIITILMIILFLFILIVPLFGTSILKLLLSLNLSNNFLTVFNIIFSILNLPLSILVIFILIKIIYTIAPDEKIPSKYVNKGALFTTFFWIVITTVYSYYVNTIASYNVYYGGLSNIIILMLWFYFMAYVFIVGLVLNYRNIEEQTERTNTIKLNEIKEKIEESKNKSKKS